MAESPFRQRRVSPERARRVVARAAALAAIDPVHPEDAEALTEEELETRLAALGIPRGAVQRALREGEAGASVAADDGAIRVVRDEEVAGMVPPERHEEVAEAIAGAMGMPGRVSAVGNKLTWVPGGILQEPAVTVHSKNGVTRVHYVETLANRGQTTIGFATLAAICALATGGLGAGLAGAILKAAGVGIAVGGSIALAVGAVFGLMAAYGAFVGLRRMLDRRARVRGAFADRVVSDTLAATQKAVLSDAPRTRIAQEAEAASEAEAEAAGEAEPELAGELASERLRTHER